MNKILIIEDDRDIADMAAIILEKEGYQVSVFTHFIGYESVINESGADLVLLDLNIRGYQGKEICWYIKQTEYLKQIKVVLMSANPDIVNVKEQVRADAAISKPFDIEYFVKIIAAQIHQPQNKDLDLIPDNNLPC
jgi:DNA-binding response OmpR family regulator